MSAAYEDLPSSRVSRFDVGDTFTYCGVNFRVVAGDKKDGDMRLDWYADGAWRPITFEPLFLMADFFYENEDWLHPPPRKGGQYVFEGMRRAVNHGHVAAWTHVKSEKKFKGCQDPLPGRWDV